MGILTPDELAGNLPDKTDEQRIEEAAFCIQNKILPLGECLEPYDYFKAGVQWRDKNPSPAVMKLLEAAKEVSWHRGFFNLNRAIAEFEKELGK